MTAPHRYHPLTPDEAKIIDGKGTETPFSGEYDDFFRDGEYVCRRCDATLYRAADKFDAGCGWPSFDAEIQGAVERRTDADGRRTEIVCAACGAHLGHEFMGEKLTIKDSRHCVNSLSIRFIPAETAPGETGVAVFGGGCFWCVEAAFKGMPGVLAAVSGYAGGHSDQPTYEAVSRGDTGHAEVVRIEYNPNTVAYPELLRVFFKVHDPTTVNRQGNDVGPQYRSIIFYTTIAQKAAAEGQIREATERNTFGRPVVTEVRPLMRFYRAEEYHQNYFAKNPDNAYCQAVIRPKLEKLGIGN
jgi:peptide methionine sulfoxide reductase msrA/msrB